MKKIIFILAMLLATNASADTITGKIVSTKIFNKYSIILKISDGVVEHDVWSKDINIVSNQHHYKIGKKYDVYDVEYDYNNKIISMVSHHQKNVLEQLSHDIDSPELDWGYINQVTTESVNYNME